MDLDLRDFRMLSKVPLHLQPMTEQVQQFFPITIAPCSCRQASILYVVCKSRNDSSPLNLKFAASVVFDAETEALAGGEDVGGGVGPLAGRGSFVGGSLKARRAVARGRGERGPPRCHGLRGSSAPPRAPGGSHEAEGGVQWTCPGGCRARPALPAAVLWGAAVSRTRWRARPCGTVRSICLRKARPARARGRREHWPLTEPGAPSSAAHREGGPGRLSSGGAAQGGRAAAAGPAGGGRGPGAGSSRRRSAPARAPAARGGGRRWRGPWPRRADRPSRWNGSARGGCRPKAPQRRWSAVCACPAACALERSDQCGASAGVEVSLRSITAAPFSSALRRRRPGRGSSASPSRRALTKRLRHGPTGCSCLPRAAAPALLPSPSAPRRLRRPRSDRARHTGTPNRRFPKRPFLSAQAHDRQPPSRPAPHRDDRLCPTRRAILQ